MKIFQALRRAEFWRYICAGLLTTAVNTLVFAKLGQSLGFARWLGPNSLAIVLSICFAYPLNRCWVFGSKKPILAEFISFFTSRLAISFVFENGFYYLLYDVFGLHSCLTWGQFQLPYVKLLAQIGVVFANYLVGKFMVFFQKGASQ